MNHYEWLEENLPIFFKNIGVKFPSVTGLITAHGDKVYSYKRIWEENNIHFYHGTALYLLGHLQPYSKEVRETQNGWVAPVEWVINNYDRFKEFLPKC